MSVGLNIAWIGPVATPAFVLFRGRKREPGQAVVAGFLVLQEELPEERASRCGDRGHPMSGPRTRQGPYGK